MGTTERERSRDRKPTTDRKQAEARVAAMQAAALQERAAEIRKQPRRREDRPFTGLNVVLPTPKATLEHDLGNSNFLLTPDDEPLSPSPISPLTLAALSHPFRSSSAPPYEPLSRKFSLAPSLSLTVSPTPSLTSLSLTFSHTHSVIPEPASTISPTRSSSPTLSLSLNAFPYPSYQDLSLHQSHSAPTVASNLYLPHHSQLDELDFDPSSADGDATNGDYDPWTCIPRDDKEINHMDNDPARLPLPKMIRDNLAALEAETAAEMQGAGFNAVSGSREPSRSRSSRKSSDSGSGKDGADSEKRKGSVEKVVGRLRAVREMGMGFGRGKGRA